MKSLLTEKKSKCVKGYVPRIRPRRGGQTLLFSTYQLHYTFTGFLIHSLRVFQNTYFNIFPWHGIPFAVFWLGYGTGRLRNRGSIRGRVKRYFLLFATSRPSLGSTESHIHWVPAAGSPGLKLTTRLHLVPRLKVELYLPSLHTPWHKYELLYI